MRKIGQLTTDADARRFQRYLQSQRIDSQIDAAGDGFEVWVYQEDQLATAREELRAFQQHPHDTKYNVRLPPAEPVRPEPESRQRTPRDVPESLIGQMPLTITLILTSITITFATNFGREPTWLFNELLLTQFVKTKGFTWLPREVLQGQIWRLYTPMFLHLDEIHLLFNMLMLWFLGGAIERVRGWRYLLGLILVVAPVSHLAQYLVGNSVFGGFSGVLYGLFAFIWIRSALFPDEGFEIPQAVVVQMLLWLMLCFTNLLGEVANWSHLGGLWAGMMLGGLPVLWRRR